MSNLDNTIANMEARWRTMTQRWEETKQVWNDPVRQKFEREYWITLEGLMPAVGMDMERLSQVIAQAKRNVK